MKTMLLLVFVLLSSQTAYAGFELLVSIAKDSPINRSKLDEVTHRPEVLKQEDLFSGRELKNLQEIGVGHLQFTKLITVRNETAAATLEDFVGKLGKEIRIERRSLEIKTASDTFSAEQWALSNDSDQQPLELDFGNSYWVPSIKGQDVGLSRADFSNFPVKRKVRVAILDTGIDTTHPDLKDHIARNESECKLFEQFRACVNANPTGRAECEKKWFLDPAADADHDGYPLDCAGWNLVALKGAKNSLDIMGGPEVEDSMGHGTHVAGIVAAVADNNEGVRGISQNTEIIPVQVISQIRVSEPIKPLGDDGPNLDPEEGKSGRPPIRAENSSTFGDIVARGVIYAIHAKADVINLSLGWPGSHDSSLMRDVIGAAQSRGIVVVAAAGNDSTRALLYPCAYKGVVCVASQGPDGSISHFSNYGSGVDISAPGLNILSTWPMKIRPPRFRKRFGYNFLNGTSQASPLVAGLIAELMARGMSGPEAYARLILGAREVLPPLALKKGSPHTNPESIPNSQRKDPYQKFVLSGNADLPRALQVEKQSLVIPATKDRVRVIWNMKDPVISIPFQLKNLWKDSLDTTIKVGIAKETGAYAPKLLSVEGALTGSWPAEEERKYVAKIQAQDAQNLSQTRMPSYVDLVVEVFQSGKKQLRFLITAEILIRLNSETPNVNKIAIPKIPVGKGGRPNLDFVSVDQIFDADQDFHDYLVSEQRDTVWNFSYLYQDRSQGPLSDYKLRGTFQIPTSKDQSGRRLQIVARGNFLKSGGTQIMVGIYDPGSTEDGKIRKSGMTFYLLKEDLALISGTKYEEVKSALPLEETGTKIQWSWLKDRKVPVWIFKGLDPYRTASLGDLWENPDSNEDGKTRLYFLDEKGELQAQDDYKGYQFIGLLTPSLESFRSGKVPILLAKSRGTEETSSYLYDFARAEFSEGKVTNFQPVDFFSQGVPYRRLFGDTVPRVTSSPIVSLAGDGDYVGTYWYGSETLGEQRATLLFDKEKPAKILDYKIKAIRGTVDGALWVRAAFSGKNRSAAFVFSNSEIQYHDFTKGQAALISMDRYTFISDRVAINQMFPMVIYDDLKKESFPGLWRSTESQLIGREVVTVPSRTIVPLYDAKGDLQSLTVPVKFRWIEDETENCSSLDTFFSIQGKTYLDFKCNGYFLRMPLVY